MRLIVTARGTKRWELWISINGKPRQLGFGAYPDVSLRYARDEADKIRSAAHRGLTRSASASRSRMRWELAAATMSRWLVCQAPGRGWAAI